MKCIYCEGRGWSWVSVATHDTDDIEKLPCEPCDGYGRMTFNWQPLIALLLVIASAVFSLALLLWSAHTYFGE